MNQEQDNDFKQLKEKLPQMDISQVYYLLQETNKNTQPRRYNLLKKHLAEMEEIRSGLLGKSNTSPEKYPKLSNAVLLLLFLVALQLAVTITARWLVSRIGIGLNNSIEIAIAGVANLVAFTTVIIYASRYIASDIKKVMLINGFNIFSLFPLIISVIGLSIIGSEIDNLIRHLFPPSELIEKTMRDITTSGPAGIFTLVIIAPLTEEFLFRGLFLHGFARNYGKRGAIIASALLFALIHLNPYQMIPAFLAGLFLGWITLNSGSIWPAIISHGLTNGLLLLVSWLRPDISGVVQRGVLEYQPLWLNALGVILLIAGIMWLMKIFQTKDIESIYS